MNEPTKVRRLAIIETRLDVAVEALERALEDGRGALWRNEQLHTDISAALRRLLRCRTDLKLRLIQMHTAEE